MNAPSLDFNNRIIQDNSPVVLDEPEITYIDAKTMRRYKRYRKFISSKRTNSVKPKQFEGFRFEYDDEKKNVLLLSLKIDDYECDLVIPKKYTKGVYNVKKREWCLITDLKKGDTFRVDESLYRLFPTFFKSNKTYKLSDDIQIIYYSFENKKDLLRLTKHILFQQIKMIYRYQRNAKKAIKNN